MTGKDERTRVVIVDDEDLARRLLREYLDADGRVDIVAECANGFEAVKAVTEFKPDLIFLDIQMPKLDGFEVLELIDPGVAVIFVTAFDQFALRAFDARAVDYLLKPFGEDRLWKALDRARERMREETVSPGARAELASAGRPPGQTLERIAVRDGAKVHVIPVAKLDYAEAQDDYIALHSEQTTYLKQQPISALEQHLDPRRFVRVHRSYLVNVERIASIEPYTKDSRIAILRDGARIPVSRAGYEKLKELLGDAL